MSNLANRIKEANESQGGSGDGGVQQDESGGAGSGETHQRGTQRQDLRLGMDQPDLLRDLVRRTSPGEEGLEAIPDVHSEEDREVGERSRDHQEGEEQEFRARVPPQHSEGGLLYGPMRRNSGSQPRTRTMAGRRSKETSTPEKSSQEIQELAQAVAGLMQMMQHLDRRFQGLENKTCEN